jgi:hypothetical protein
MLPESLQHLQVANDDLVHADHMSAALTAGTLVFGGGATQVFTADGHTTFTEHGQPSQGEWWVVGDGTFGSYWPPSYRATYELRWAVENGVITGLTFTETGGGARFDGRYR